MAESEHKDIIKEIQALTSKADESKELNDVLNATKTIMSTHKDLEADLRVKLQDIPNIRFSDNNTDPASLIHEQYIKQITDKDGKLNNGIHDSSLTDMIINSEIRNKNIYNALKTHHPAWRDMSTDEAIDIVASVNSPLAFKNKPVVPIIAVAAHTKLLREAREITPEQIGEIRERIFKDNEGFMLDEKVSYDLLQKANPDGKFALWEAQRRAQISEAMDNDPELAYMVSQIKPFMMLEDQADFAEQLKLKHGIAERLAPHYAKAYDVDISAKDIYTVMRPPLAQDNTKAETISAIGVEGEEHIVIYEGITDNILETDGQSQISAAHRTLSTIHEELRHHVDAKYADKLVLGELPEDHLAFNHAALYTVNAMDYNINMCPIGPMLGMEYDNINFYENQYAERTAKDHAAELADNAIARAYSPEELAELNGQIAEEEAEVPESIIKCFNTSSITTPITEIEPPAPTQGQTNEAAIPFNR